MINANKVIKALSDYAVATDTPVSLVNTEGEILYSSNGEKHCHFCSSIGHTPNDCFKTFKYGCLEAQRFGGKYIFFCSMGLTHWASPILDGGVMQYGIVGGPVIMVDEEDFVYFDLSSKINTDKQNLKELKCHLSSISHVEPHRVTSVCELLMFTAAFLSEGNEGFNVESQSNQSRVSEYIHYIKTMSQDYWDLSYPLEKEKELIGYILDGNKDKAAALLNEILGHILFKSGNDFETIKARVLELVVVLSRAVIEGGGDAERIFDRNYQYIKEVRIQNDIEGLVNWLNNVMQRFGEEVFENANIKHFDSIYKAMRHIKSRYMDKISLDEVAQLVNFSPSYFSKIFKEETGKSFNTYLNLVRIENSKKLLTGSNLGLIEIANMMGFEDQSYYSKVFKKVVGITPGKYREKRGK